MLIPRFVAWIFSTGLMVLSAGVVSGQDYPNKLIRIITSEPGTGSDFMARLIAQALTDSVGQPVIVENRGGASGVIAAQTVVKAPPDGYTLLMYANTIWIAPLIQNLPYDPVRDFAPITMPVSSPMILVVHPSFPVKSVRELIALAKAKPGELNYATSVTGGATHLASELFKTMAGVNIVRISYKGGGQALYDLIAGQVHLAITTMSPGWSHVKSGKLRALAVTSAQPSALAPGLPTVAASGVPGYESIASYGIFVPARTPSTIINRLNQEIVRALNRADVKEKFLSAGIETVGNSPEEFAAYIKSDMAKLGKLIKDAGIRAE